MAMGMSYTEFWDGPPSIAVAYRKAHRLRRELENEMAWLQGMYNYDAFTVVLSNAFRSKGAKRQKYMEKPMDIFPLTAAEKQRREREEYAKMEAAMKAMVRKQRAEKSKDDV